MTQVKRRRGHSSNWTVNKKPKLSPNTAKAVRKIVRKTINAAEETKRYSRLYGDTLAHTLLDPFYFSYDRTLIDLHQGDADGERVGDDLKMTGVRVNFSVRNYNPEATAGIYFRLLLCKIPYQSTPYTLGQVFRAPSSSLTTANYYEFLRDVNVQQGVEIVHDEMLTVNKQYNSNGTAFSSSRFIPYRKKIKFGQAGSTYDSSGKDLYVVVVAHGIGLGASLTQFGEFNVHSMWTYKDS